MSGTGMDAHKAPGPQGRSDSIDDYDVFDDAKTYYAADRHKGTKASARTRTFSQVCFQLAVGRYVEGYLLTAMTMQNSLMQQMERLGLKEPFRRGSHGTQQEPACPSHTIECSS